MNSRMKGMIRAVAVVLCSAGMLAGVAMAQTDAAPAAPQGQMQGPPPGGRGGWGARGGDPAKRLEMMQKRLKLTDDQTAQVKAIFADGRSKMEALRSNTALALQDRRSQGRTLMEQEDAKVEAVLTPDQKAKYEEMKEKQRERMEEHGGRGGQGGPPPPPPPPSL